MLLPNSLVACTFFKPFPRHMGRAVPILHPAQHCCRAVPKTVYILLPRHYALICC